MRQRKKKTLPALVRVQARTFERLFCLSQYLTSVGSGRRVSMGEVVDWLVKTHEAREILDDEAAVKTNG